MTHGYQECIVCYGNGSWRAQAQAPTAMTDWGEERRVRPLYGLGGSDTGDTDQGERETEEAQGRPRGSGTSAGRQERPWRL